MPTLTKKVCIISTGKGCASNLMENALLSREIENQGMICTSSAADADFLIIGSCGYSAESENFTLQTLKDFKQKFPNKEIIVGGCLPKINNQELKKIHSGNTFSPGETNLLLSHLGITNEVSYAPIEGIQLSDDVFYQLPWHYRFFCRTRNLVFKFENFTQTKFQPLHNILKTATVTPQAINLPIAKGCLGTCTYCAIKKARGPVISTPLHEILQMFQSSLEKKHNEFWLNADDLGCWGQDIGSNIVILLKEILSFKQNFTLVLSYLSPEWLIRYKNDLLSLLKDPRIIAVYIPIHSGSNSILKRMGRHYTIEEILPLCQKLKENNKQLALKTNYILSFPNETFYDFIKSCLTMHYFDFIVFNTFSPRPETPAFYFPHRKNAFYRTTCSLFFKIATSAHHLYIALSSLVRRST